MNTKSTSAAFLKFDSSLTEEERAVLINNPKLLKQLGERMIKWRKFAIDLGYDGPVLWRIREGFTLKEHAPNAGPCYQGFEYLKNCIFENDEPTKSAYVFFVPRLIETSTDKNVDEQMALMAEMRKRYDLPEHHLTSFGSAAMLTGLVLAYFGHAGERTPLNMFWARTDTLREGRQRFAVGPFSEEGLICDYCTWDLKRLDNLGCFPLGVEVDPPADSSGL